MPSSAAPRVLALLAVLSGPATAQQFDELVGRGLPRELETTELLQLCDVDGDAHLDLIVGVDALFPGAPLRLLLGSADGIFTVAAHSRLPARLCLPAALVCGDFDGDGDADLFVANRDHAQNLLYRNDGTGNFTDVTAGALPALLDDSRAATAFDADHDGDPDLLVVQVFATATLLVNHGTGRFQLRGSMPTLGSADPTAVVALDIDADGDLDVAIANAGGQNRLWRNEGGYVFTDVTAAAMPADQDVTAALGTADFDGDGVQDLLAGNVGSRDRLYRGDGAGAFTSDPAWVQAPIGSTRALAAADVDADGDADACIARFGAPDQLLINDGTGRLASATAPWPASPSHTRALVAGDVDGDGDVDLVTGSGRSLFAPGRKELRLNDGRGTFHSATAVGWPAPDSSTMAIGHGDLDGDGEVDVVTASGTAVVTWRGDGRGGLHDPRTFPGRVGPDPVQAMAVGDLDGDARPDVVIGTTSGSLVLRNDGAGDLLADHAALPAGGGDVRAVLLVDLDGDRDLDVVEGNAGRAAQHAQQNRVLLNDASGGFTDVTAVALPAHADFTFALAAGDVDADGDLDLVVGNWSVAVPTAPRQPNQLLLNDGGGRFAPAPVGMLPADDDPTVAVVLGDVDGDGDLDLVVGNMRAPSRLLENDGSGRFTERVAALGGVRATRAAAFVDFDDDRDLDVVLGNEDAPNTLLRNEGTAGFNDAQESAFGAFHDTTTAIAVVDIDHDRDADMLVANRNDQTDRLLLGLARHLDLPVPLRAGRNFVVDVYARPAAPGGQAFLWVALQPGPPLSIPPLGELRLDPSRLFGLGVAPIAVDGVSSRVLVLPPLPALVGAPLYFQALVYRASRPTAARLTNVAMRTIGS